VWDTVTRLLKQPELLTADLERLTRPDLATRQVLEEELAEVMKRLEQLPKERERLVEGYRKGFYPDFMMREEMDKVTQEQRQLEERGTELQRQLTHLDRALAYRGQVQGLAQRLSAGLWRPWTSKDGGNSFAYWWTRWSTTRAR